jgi:hypothetical protein
MQQQQQQQQQGGCEHHTELAVRGSVAWILGATLWPPALIMQQQQQQQQESEHHTEWAIHGGLAWISRATLWLPALIRRLQKQQQYAAYTAVSTIHDRQYEAASPISTAALCPPAEAAGLTAAQLREQ